MKSVLVKVEDMTAINLLCTVKAPQEFLAVILMIKQNTQNPQLQEQQWFSKCVSVCINIYIIPSHLLSLVQRSQWQSHLRQSVGAGDSFMEVLACQHEALGGSGEVSYRDSQQRAYCCGTQRRGGGCHVDMKQQDFHQS